MRIVLQAFKLDIVKGRNSIYQINIGWGIDVETENNNLKKLSTRRYRGSLEAYIKIIV